MCSCSMLFVWEFNFMPYDGEDSGNSDGSFFATYEHGRVALQYILIYLSGVYRLTRKCEGDTSRLTQIAVNLICIKLPSHFSNYKSYLTCKIEVSRCDRYSWTRSNSSKRRNENHYLRFYLVITIGLKLIKI